MTITRIYLVRDMDSTDVRLVRAGSPAAAIRHVVRPRFEATVASQDDLVQQLANEVKVETAGAEAP